MEHHGSPWQLPEKDKSNGISPHLNSSVTSPSDLPALAAAVAAQSLQQKPNFLLPASEFTLSPLSSPTSFSPTTNFSSLAILSPPKPVPMARRSSCDLFECIEQHSRFSEEVAKFVFAQIVEVVWALGKMGICHRDIKDENIVIDNTFRVSPF